MIATSHQRMYRHPQMPWAELRISVRNGNCYRLHTHAEYSIGIVDEGQALFQHSHRREAIETGDVVLLEPHTVHSCNPAHETGWSYRMLYVNAVWLHQAMSEHWKLNEPLQALAFHQRTLHDMAASRKADHLCQPVGSADEVATRAVALVKWLSQIARPTTSNDFMPADLWPAWQLLQTDTNARTTVQAMAKACHMSASQFIRRFTVAHGMTPGHFMRNQRVNGARRMIVQGTPLADVAHAMGFADQAHLQRMFKAHHAITPGRYAR